VTRQVRIAMAEGRAIIFAFYFPAKKPGHGLFSIYVPSALAPSLLGPCLQLGSGVR